MTVLYKFAAVGRYAACACDLLGSAGTPVSIFVVFLGSMCCLFTQSRMRSADEMPASNDAKTPWAASENQAAYAATSTCAPGRKVPPSLLPLRAGIHTTTHGSNGSSSPVIPQMMRESRVRSSRW